MTPHHSPDQQHGSPTVQGVSAAGETVAGSTASLTPVCASCLRIRTPEGEWIEAEPTGSLTHGACPTCEERDLADLTPHPAGAPFTQGAPARFLPVTA